MSLFSCFSFDLLQLALPSLTSYSSRIRSLLRFCGSSDSCLSDSARTIPHTQVEAGDRAQGLQECHVFVGLNLIKEGSGEFMWASSGGPHDVILTTKQLEWGWQEGRKMSRESECVNPGAIVNRWQTGLCLNENESDRQSQTGRAR